MSIIRKSLRRPGRTKLQFVQLNLFNSRSKQLRVGTAKMNNYLGIQLLSPRTARVLNQHNDGAERVAAASE